MNRWHRRLESLPDLRWAQVMAIRRAICEGRYDFGGRLDRVAEVVAAEIDAES